MGDHEKEGKGGSGMEKEKFSGWVTLPVRGSDGRIGRKLCFCAAGVYPIDNNSF